VELNDAEAQLSVAIAQSKLAETDYNRVARIYKKDPGAVSKSLVDERKAGLESSKASVESSRARAEKAKDNIKYTSLKAPFDGVVVDKFIENFEKVLAMKQVLRIVNTKEMEFTVHIPERLMQHADKAIKAYVVYDAKPEIQVPARIKEIGNEASKTTRTYPITLIMEQPKEFKILPGMAGKASAKREIPTGIAKETGIEGIEIPISALVASKAKGSHVWVINEKNKQVAKHAVKVIKLTEKGALVTGLNPGEWIATAGANTLVEGQKVRILQ
jgi:RND family efflux transporter MFP subunit